MIGHCDTGPVFAKLGVADGAREQFTTELDGLRLLSRAARIAVPVPVASGVVRVAAGTLLLFEALQEQPPEAREPGDWRSIGHVLAALHRVRHDEFGLGGARGFFGPLPQDNRPVPAGSWPASPPRFAVMPSAPPGSRRFSMIRVHGPCCREQ